MLLCKKSVPYAVTLTLNPYFHVFALEQQYDIVDQALKDIMKKSKFEPDLTMICEVTLRMNLHFHGIVTLNGFTLPVNCLRYVNDMFRDVKYKNRQIFGSQRCIKPIDNWPVWQTYILKDVDKTRNILYCRHPIMFDCHESVRQATLMINFPDFEVAAAQ